MFDRDAVDIENIFSINVNGNREVTLEPFVGLSELM